MIKKIQVIVREVYEKEEYEEIIRHNKTGQKIESYDYKRLSDLERSEYTVGDYPTGKMILVESEGDPIYGQVFNQEQFEVRDLILHLNRTK